MAARPARSGRVHRLDINFFIQKEKKGLRMSKGSKKHINYHTEKDREERFYKNSRRGNIFSHILLNVV
ncbi:unnamed protein product [marine sediment metagenome]|uniref:Uncharacterized protein n=1 Tax=marine sediment metagenome TaxID=412755 RepID=X1H9H2_9ZZZZ